MIDLRHPYFPDVVVAVPADRVGAWAAAGWLAPELEPEPLPTPADPDPDTESDTTPEE
ncbi:hypothetical protein [Nocardioides ochotonae]|uniref:hypothetical protein n=1 Tax=Nocardioides ochotonae TaxID=2685869 RepID=UPI00140B2385|nr:hypothetical protein [Nocardioides ochotonae]